MESNLIVWSLNQLKIGLPEGMRLLFGSTEVQNQWKYTLPAESSPFRSLYFRSISMAVLSQGYTVQHLLSNKLCAQLMLNSVFLNWMLKYAMQHVERHLNVVEQNRAWVYSFQKVASCWTTSNKCHAAWWKDPHDEWNCGCIGMEL